MEREIASAQQSEHGSRERASWRRIGTEPEPALHPALELQQRAGNQAMQTLLRTGAIRAKLSISQPGDAEEQEADAMGGRILRSHAGAEATASSCSCGGDEEEMCDECRQKASIARKASGGPARTPATRSGAGTRSILRSPGMGLDAATRAFFEPRFGRDFSRVRVHTDEASAASAHSIQAHAYAAGDHLVFDKGQFAPDTDEGRKLLAHELAHVVQRQDGDDSSPIYRQKNSELDFTMTPEYARGLSNEELANEEAALSSHLEELDSNAEDDWLDDPKGGEPENIDKYSDPEWMAVAENLKTLRAERDRRASGGSNADVVGEMPRPSGLPMNEGFELKDAPPEFQALAAQIPEGRLIEVVEMPASGRSRGPQPTWATSTLNAAGVASTMNANAQLMRQGFAAAGENSIIIAAMPSIGTPGAMIPESFSYLGHTAVGARIGGEIQAVRGLSPNLVDFVRNYSAVRGGKAVAAAEITNDLSLLTKTGALTLEYPVTRDVAEAFLRGLPPPGPVGAGGPGWTAIPAKFGDVCTGQNCVYWATQQAEQTLGGRIGPIGGTPIVDVPQVAQGGQGQMMRFIRNVSQGTEEAAPMENAIGPAVAGGMSTGMRVLKVGGRVMLVFSVVMVPVETYLAPPGERERTFVGATGGLAGGFAGGFAGGAAAGLVCGPGAPVCSILLGLSFGIAGAFGGRKLAEGAYDLTEGAGRMTPMQWIDTTTLMFGTPEQKRAMCEMRDIENPDDDGFDPMCGKL